MGFFGFVFAMIVFSTVLSLGATVMAGRFAIRGARRLMGAVRTRGLLNAARQQASTEAQDVVVEPVEGPVTSATKVSGPTPPQEVLEPKQRTSRRHTQSAASSSTTVRHRDYVRLDVDDGTTAEQVADVMTNYVNDVVLGERAQTVIDTLDSAEHRRRSLFAELDGTFQRGSISWERFAAPSQEALDSILRNAALLANRIQAFDTAGYQRLFRSVQRDATSGEHSGADRRAERMRLYREMLESLDALQETNEGLLLELEKLTSELVGISSAEQADRGNPIFDEISRLVEEAKFYREAR